MAPQASSKSAPWDLTQFSQHLFHCSKHSAKSFVGIAISCPVVLSWISLTVWILFPFKGDLVLGKARSLRVPNLGCRGAESPGWFDVSLKNSAWDMVHERARCRDEAASHQLPVTAAFWIIWVVSAEECSSLTQNVMQICCSTRSVILNAMATQYTRSLNGIYRPYTVGSSIHACTFQSTLLGCQVTLMLHKWFLLQIMAGLFPDRPCTLCLGSSHI